MSQPGVHIDGQLFLSVETVAEIYAVKRVWLREVCDSGLVSGALDRDDTVWIAAVELDRVAAIVRLRAVLGDDVQAIAALLTD